jgi:hypothetical protein
MSELTRFVRLVHYGDLAWLAIVAYDLTVPDDEQLCGAVDRWSLHHKWVTRAVIAYVALHVADLLPRRYDILNHVANVLRHWHKEPEVLGYKVYRGNDLIETHYYTAKEE